MFCACGEICRWVRGKEWQAIFRLEQVERAVGERKNTFDLGAPRKKEYGRYA